MDDGKGIPHKVFEIESESYELDVDVNWNLQEAGVTYFKTTEDDQKLEMFFEIVRFSHPKTTLSLKHLTRIAILTSFTEDQLAKQSFQVSSSSIWESENEIT